MRARKKKFKPLPSGLLREYVIENIRALRQRNNWRQADLNDALGLPYGCISKIEGRSKRITLELITQIANIFEVPPAALLEETDRVFYTPSRGRPKKDADG